MRRLWLYVRQHLPFWKCDLCRRRRVIVAVWTERASKAGFLICRPCLGWAHSRRSGKVELLDKMKHTREWTREERS
jgi:hypothetical protein